MTEEDEMIQKDLSKLQSRVQRHRENLKNLEAIRTAFILPFISLLGYDAADPDQTVVSYQTDGKVKIDYALRDDEEMRIAVHINPSPSEMSNDRSIQFIETFNASEARIAIVTNGAIFNIHGSDEAGQYQSTPLLEIDLSSPRPVEASGLELLGPESFDQNAFRNLSVARRMRDQIVAAIESSLQNPDENLAASVMSNLPESDSVDTFTVISLISEAAPGFRYTISSGDSSDESAPEPDNGGRPPMTDDETLAFHIVRAIGAKHVSPDRIYARPVASYISVILDDNNRKQIARIHYKFESSKKLGTFSGDNAEERHPIKSSSEIYTFEKQIADRLIELTSPTE